ncbi:HupE/UreJ family protein [Hyunsoonleella sp. SJ7]|uniref:HupE/UreJ family protein n=1 Tax=Hyunsoonleella aquatilis TaxID=2762758 RepID=A0A923HBQ7_9FLAO|nr:HupE/UreJ family protein [Hyunsoonleella aquatilis]MBC3758156.1 HupE/UreJ family protein [Hyunsoonleella aquatilis]
MFDDFLSNVEYGINHVLDINAYDHVLFLMVLTIPYMFKDWKRVLLLVSVFTLGHTLSLILAAYSIVSVSAALIEFLIPITILVVAIFNVFTAGKGARKDRIGVVFLTTLFFGLIHGLGFAREFRMVFGDADHKWLLLLEFALGIEVAQIIIVFIVLFLGYLVQTIFRFSKRDWIMVISAIVIGLTIPMLLNGEFF